MYLVSRQYSSEAAGTFLTPLFVTESFQYAEDYCECAQEELAQAKNVIRNTRKEHADMHWVDRECRVIEEVKKILVHDPDIFDDLDEYYYSHELISVR